MNISVKNSIVYFTLTIIFCGSLTSQYQESHSQLTATEKDKLVKIADELFIKRPTIALHVSTYDVTPDLEKIPNPIKYDKMYLDSLLGALKLDEFNSSIMWKIAEYYAAEGQSLLAQSYFEKALANLHVDSFKDPAAYYSNRAVLKNRLGIKDALEDLEQSLAINPNDSLTIQIYPMMLMQNNEYEKVREVLWRALENESGSKLYAYLTLISAEINEAGKQSLTQRSKRPNINKKSSKKNYDEIIDFSLIDKFAELHPNELEIIWSRRIADILGLFAKMTFFAEFENNRILFPFTTYDLDKIESLIQQFSEASGPESINEYSRNRCLGYLYFLNSEWDQSLTHFKRAIEIFPDEKKDMDFNTEDCQYMMMTIYAQESDAQNYRKLIRNKVENEPDKSKSIDDLMLLAYDYFQNQEIQQAEALCNEAMLIDSNYFSTLRLKSHLSFLQGERQLAQFYLENAGKNLNDPSQEYNLALQYAIYLLYDGNAEMAKTILESLLASIGSENCAECEMLIKEFCR